MQRSLTLTPSFQTQFAAGSSASFRLSLVVTAATNVDANVFLYLANPVQPGASDRSAKFNCICSPVDLAAQPVAAPDADADPAWFRLDRVTIDFRTRAEALSVYADIQADVQRLLEALSAQDTLAALPPVTLSAGS